MGRRRRGAPARASAPEAVGGSREAPPGSSPLCVEGAGWEDGGEAEAGEAEAAGLAAGIDDDDDDGGRGEDEAEAFPTLRLDLPEPTNVRIRTAEFVKSSVEVAQCPKEGPPEFAVIGRSNVGKSSLINMMTGRRSLAQVSKEPGAPGRAAADEREAGAGQRCRARPCSGVERGAVRKERRCGGAALRGAALVQAGRALACCVLRLAPGRARLPSCLPAKR